MNNKTTFIRIQCKFCVLCAKMTIFCVFVVDKINCQRCKNNNDEYVSTNHDFHFVLIFTTKKNVLTLSKNDCSFYS